MCAADARLNTIRPAGNNGHALRGLVKSMSAIFMYSSLDHAPLAAAGGPREDRATNMAINSRMIARRVNTFAPTAPLFGARDEPRDLFVSRGTGDF